MRTNLFMLGSSSPLPKYAVLFKSNDIINLIERLGKIIESKWKKAIIPWIRTTVFRFRLLHFGIFGPDFFQNTFLFHSVLIGFCQNLNICPINCLSQIPRGAAPSSHPARPSIRVRECLPIQGIFIYQYILYAELSILHIARCVMTERSVQKSTNIPTELESGVEKSHPLNCDRSYNGGIIH